MIQHHLFFLDPIGFNFKGSLNKIESIIKTKIDEDKRNGVIGGRSVIALLVPSQGTPADNEKLDITEKLDNFKLYLPGTTFISDDFM